MTRQTKVRWVIGVVLSCSLLAYPSDKKDKAKPSVQTVDSGSFGVFVKGKRVVTETFSVEQQNDVSVIKAQLKEADNPGTIQKSELRLTSGGELIRYDWSQESGGSLTVLPNNEFLIEKIMATATSKPAEQPFLMPGTSVILDNNNFVQREVLIWRYLAADCKPEEGGLKCQQGPVEFGVLVPQDHTSIRVRVELVGKDKIPIHGAERELLRVNLTGESFEWALWVDAQDQFKVMRAAIPADSTEIVRD